MSNLFGVLLTEVGGFKITAQLVQPVVDAINSGLTTLLPVGIGIMAIMMGVHLIPRILYKFF